MYVSDRKHVINKENTRDFRIEEWEEYNKAIMIMRVCVWLVDWQA
jgi:hypothetical protein